MTFQIIFAYVQINMLKKPKMIRNHETILKNLKCNIFYVSLGFILHAFKKKAPGRM